MAYDDLRDWIQALDRAGELKRIRTETDPILEITEITDRVSKSPAPVERQPPSAGVPGARSWRAIASPCSGLATRVFIELLWNQVG